MVLEAGRIVGDGCQTLPLFYQCNLFECGIFGSPIWYRNVSAVSINCSAFKRLLCEGNEPAHSTFAEKMTNYCSMAIKLGYRGLVNPHARAYFSNDCNEEIGEFNSSYTTDPYFHPEFESVAPLKLKRC